MTPHENGFSIPSVDVVINLAHVFHTDVNSVLNYTTNPTENLLMNDLKLAVEGFVCGEIPTEISDCRKSVDNVGILLVKDKGAEEYSLPTVSIEPYEPVLIGLDRLMQDTFGLQIVDPCAGKVRANVCDNEVELLHLTERVLKNSKKGLKRIRQLTYVVEICHEDISNIVSNKDVICVPWGDIKNIRKYCKPSLPLKLAVEMYSAFTIFPWS